MTPWPFPASVLEKLIVSAQETKVTESQKLSETFVKQRGIERLWASQEIEPQFPCMNDVVFDL